MFHSNNYLFELP